MGKELGRICVETPTLEKHEIILEQESNFEKNVIEGVVVRTVHVFLFQSPERHIDILAYSVGLQVGEQDISESQWFNGILESGQAVEELSQGYLVTIEHFA